LADIVEDIVFIQRETNVVEAAMTITFEPDVSWRTIPENHTELMS
jgi:hypothetical protein